MQAVEKPLDIPDVVQQVRQHDDVERAFECRQVVGVRLDEVQAGCRRRARQHRGREVDANACAGASEASRSPVPQPISSTRDPAGTRTVDVLEPAVVRASDVRPVLVRCCDAIPVRNPLRAIGLAASSTRWL